MFENDCFLEFGETESGEAAVFFALNEDDPDVGIHFSTAAH